MENAKIHPSEDDLSELKTAMRRTCIFCRLQDPDIREVAQKMTKISFSAGEQLGAGEGEPTRALYVITRGRVERRRLGQLVDDSITAMGDLPPGYENASWSRNTFGKRDSIVTSTPSGHDPSGAAPRGNSGEPTASAGKPTAGKIDAIERVGEGHDLVAFGTLSCLSESASFATTTALSDGEAWRLESPALRALFNQPSVARGIAEGLSAEIFRMSEAYRTPLLEQPPQVVNVAAVSVAAAFESYYRAAMNSLLNASLTGTTGGAMFPNMNVQIPTRVLYINGFKYTRQLLSNEVNARLERAGTCVSDRERSLLFFVPALLPGVLMTPVSGLLEACNAGHSNPEPLAKRMWRGLAPRCVREVIFGVGLNQLSDFCEERVPDDFARNKLVRNAMGSVIAGIAAGYLSHVPHNLSTMKLLQPAVSYRQHFNTLVNKAKASLPEGLPPHAVAPLSRARALLLPQGLFIRSTQIVGSFVLLNGISHMLDVRLWGSAQTPASPPSTPAARAKT